MNDQTLQNSPQVLGKNFKQDIINIGSHPENDIVIKGKDVQPFHASLMKNNGAYQCVLLSPEASIAINGKNYTESPIAVHEFEQLNIGGNDIMFQTSGPDEGLRVFVSKVMTGAAPEKYLVEDDNDPIVVEVRTPELEIDVEETAQFELEIVNGGPIVASFYLRIEGIPEEWVQIEPPILNLNETERRFVRVMVTPPRDSSSTAGLHDINLVVSSPNYYGHKIEKQLELTIRPFYQFSLGALSPRQKRIPWRKKRGTTFLPITNESNDTANFNVSSYDEENGCSFEFNVSEDLQLNRQATIPIEAGAQLNLPIEIRPLKPKVFAMQAKQYYYTTNVQIQEQGLTPQMVSGMAISQPLFGWWSIVLTVLTILITLFIVLQPRINSFGVAAGKDIIELGDSTRLEWSVSPFASRVSITDLDEEIARGQTSLTVTPTQSTTYELVSGNWLSGLVGMDYVRKETILVVPPAPKIGVFDVDQLEVDKGSPIRLRWSATKVDELILTVDNVVYPLEEANFSGEQEFILEDDAIITLEAKNASGSELRSYFVDVVPPQIDVIEFTVWAQPSTTGSDPYQPRLGLSPVLFPLSDVPDPNFPDRLVSLVPDIESELGYRVEFYQPDRELAKGEQIMVQWKINGVDTVQITPFGEELPNQGLQPFFPQESMNFVLTAQSGELEQLFMLPVKVFDGEPPEAPTIDFFQATPTKLKEEGKVQFSWSVSGEWTRVQLVGADGILSDYLNPVGFTDMTIAESSTIILTAYNGDLSSAAPIDIEVDPALKDIGIYFKNAYPASGRFLVNESVAFTVDFYDPDLSDPANDIYVEPETAPTGKILVSDGYSICTITLPSKTCDLTFDTPGDPKEIKASYEGDDTYVSKTSDIYGEYIAVISSSVTLTPTYYYLDRDEPENSPNSTPIGISNVSIETGIFIRVRVTPQGAPLPEKPGTVNMYLCDQEGDDIVAGSCYPYGFATVELSGSNGIADIIIDSFPKAGLHAILLSYSADGFEPAEWTEYGVNVSKIEIALRLDSCTDPEDFVGCQIGTSETASATSKTNIAFQIWRSDTVVPERLLYSLVSPEKDAFEIWEVIGGKITNWDCSLGVEIENGKNYRILECSTKFVGASTFRSSTTVNFQFSEAEDNNYTYLDPDNFDFDLNIKSNTLVSLKAASFQNLTVGQIVNMTTASGTGAAVNLTDFSGTAITPDGNIIITSDQTGTFGLAAGADPAECVIVTGNENETLTITDNTTACPVYFKHVGDYNLTVAYAGTTDRFKSESTNPLLVSVAQQDQLELDWWYEQSGSYVAWDLTSITPNQLQDIRLTVQGPAGFSDNAILDKRLKVTLNEPTCSISGSNVTFGYPEYRVKIVQDSTENVADFTLSCTSKPKTLVISVELINTTDFAFAPSEITAQTIGILDRGGQYINVSFVRTSDKQPMLTGTYPGGTMEELNFGEKYTLQVTVGRIWADSSTSRLDVINGYIASQYRVAMKFTTELYDMIDWNKTTCPAHPTISNALGIVMDDYSVVYDFGDDNLSNPGASDIEMFNKELCNLYFDVSPSNTNVPVLSGGTITFEYNIPVPGGTPVRGPISTVLDKQDIGLTSDPTDYKDFIDSTSSSMTLEVAPEISATGLDPLDSTTFSDLFDITPTCGDVSGSFSNGTPTLTISPETPITDCTGNITVDYKGNDWFNTQQLVIASVVEKHNPDISIYFKAGGNYYLFEPTYPTMQEGNTMEMQIQVHKGTDGFASTPSPSGTVLVWMTDSTGAIIVPTAASSPYSIDDSPATVDLLTSGANINKYQIDLNNQSDAFFTLEFLAAGSNLVLHYEYEGDTYYFIEADNSEYLEFQAAPVPTATP